MKRHLAIMLILLVSLTGCMTANQLAAEKSFYEAMVAMQKSSGVNPLVQIIPQDKDRPIVMQNVASFTVYAPPAASSGPVLTQYVQKDYVQPWLNLVGMAVPWFGAWGIVKASSDAIASIPHVNSTTNTTTLNAGGNAMMGGTMTTTATTNTYSNTVSGTGNVANIGGTVTQSTAPPNYPPKP